MRLPLAAYNTGAGASGMKTNKQTMYWTRLFACNYRSVFYLFVKHLYVSASHSRSVWLEKSDYCAQYCAAYNTGAGASGT